MASSEGPRLPASVAGPPPAFPVAPVLPGVPELPLPVPASAGGTPGVRRTSRAPGTPGPRAAAGRTARGARALVGLGGRTVCTCASGRDGREQGHRHPQRESPLAGCCRARSFVRRTKNHSPIPQSPTARRHGGEEAIFHCGELPLFPRALAHASRGGPSEKQPMRRGNEDPEIRKRKFRGWRTGEAALLRFASADASPSSGSSRGPA